MNGSKINVMIFETDKDIKEARSMVEAGELFSLAVENTINESILDLMKHFSKNPYFETVQDKTVRMIAEKIIPRYMY